MSTTRTASARLVTHPAATAFDELAPAYDQQWTGSLVGRLQREAVWRCLDKHFQPGQRILDLGCGTGADAVHLARRGVSVHSIDASPQMVTTARKSVERAGVAQRVAVENLAVEDLARLATMEPFDGALSNFGALNCLSDLRPVAAELGRLVRPGGHVALCLMGRFCLWETIWYLLHLGPAKAFRRLRGRAEASTPLGYRFVVHYPTVRTVRQVFSRDFRLVDVRGVGIFVPPSYASASAERFSASMKSMAAIDQFVERRLGFRAIADHRLLIFVRR